MFGERITVQDLVPAVAKAGAIYLTPVKMKFASGLMSSLYFNIGDLVISFPEEKELIVGALVQTYRDANIVSDRLIGVPEGMNCLTSSLTDKLRIGQLRVREVITGHGDQRSIEGQYTSHQSVAVFEDVITTGSSTLTRVVEPLRGVHLNPNIIIALIDREYGGIQMLRDKLQLPVLAFATTSEIAKELIRSSVLNDHQLRLLQEELETLKALKIIH